jgi:hypothetical protein
MEKVIKYKPYITIKEFNHLWENGSGNGLKRAICNTGPSHCLDCPLGEHDDFPSSIHRGTGLCGCIVLRNNRITKGEMIKLLSKWIQKPEYEDV